MLINMSNVSTNSYYSEDGDRVTMAYTVKEICGREVRFRECASDSCIVTFFADFDEKDLSGLMESLPGVSIMAVKVNDWNQELSPWKADPVFGDETFGDGAEDTLSFIEDKVRPEIGCDRLVIGGYSLAGLFSLWACYRSDAFEGCCASSPSVWFPKWDEFIGENRFLASKAYLSLGEKESRTRNQVMSTVADRIRMQFDSLSEQIGPDNVTLEWNKGGHFQDVNDRKARSFQWMLERI